MKFKYIRITIFISALFIQSIGIELHAEDNEQSRIKFTSEEIIDLSFKDCKSLIQYLENESISSYEFEKFRVVEALRRVIYLDTASISSEISSAGLFNKAFQPYEISRIFDPDRENNAKLCALNGINLMSPQAIIALPAIYKLIDNRTATVNIRKKALETSNNIISKIKTKLSPDLIKNLINEILLNKTTLSKPISLSLFIFLSNFHQEELLKLIENNPKLNWIAMQAITAVDNSGENSISYFIKNLENFNKESISIIIDQLKYYSKDAFPSLIKLISQITENHSLESELNFKGEILELLKKISSQDKFFTNSTYRYDISEKELDSYLQLIEKSNYENRINILRILIKSRFSSENNFCKKKNNEVSLSLIEKTPELNFFKNILSKVICPISIDRNANLNKSITNQDISKTISIILALGENNLIEKETIKNSLKVLDSLVTNKKTKEHEYLTSLLLFYLSKKPESELNPQIISHAIINLKTSGDIPLVLNDIIKPDLHPSILYFQSHGQSYLNKISELLKHKSILIRYRAAQIITEENFKYNVSIEKNIFNLLNDSEIKIQRIAYDYLKKNFNQIKINTIKKYLNDKSPSVRYYTSKIYLESLKNLNQDINPKEVNKLIKIFSSSISKTNCQIYLSSLAETIINNIENLDIKIVNQILNSYLKCSSLSPKNLLNTIPLFHNIKVISEENKDNIKSILNKNIQDLKDFELINLLNQISKFFTSEEIFKLIEIYLDNANSNQIINFYLYLTNQNTIKINKTQIKNLLKKESKIKSINQINSFLTKLLNNDYSAASIYNEISRLNLDNKSLIKIIKLIPRDTIKDVLIITSEKEFLNYEFVNLKSALCAILPFEENCSSLFKGQNHILYDEKFFIESAIKFQVQRYVDYKNLIENDSSNTNHNKDRNDSQLGEIILLIEEYLLSGVYLQEDNVIFDNLNEYLQIINDSKPPLHIEVMKNILLKKLSIINK